MLLILLSSVSISYRPQPDGKPPGPFAVSIRGVSMDGLPAGWTLHGAWEIIGDDPRLAGLSGLDSDGDQLVAVTDWGRLVRFAPPGPGASQLAGDVSEWTGDGLASRDRRDAEAVALGDGGLWVSLERQDRLLLLDPKGGEVRRTVDLAGEALPHNAGIEAVIPPRDDGPVIAIAEGGTQAFRIDGEALASLSVVGATGSVTGAARLGDGTIILTMRRIGPLGMEGRVALARLDGDMLRIGAPIRLPTGGRDNVEGIATAPLPGGATRLWMVTDNNRVPYFRALIIAIDVAPGAWPGAKD